MVAAFFGVSCEHSLLVPHEHEDKSNDKVDDSSENSVDRDVSEICEELLFSEVVSGSEDNRRENKLEEGTSIKLSSLINCIMKDRSETTS